uniref:S1-like domain-containing protein n=1 Tax=Oryza punctata TaxID=4537 RepID=A0A0E0K7U5_ORYPU
MKAGRKNLRRACSEGAVTLAEGESIMQVLALRGSNVIEVMDAKGVKSLALFPAKFQKSFWIKKGEWSRRTLGQRSWSLRSRSERRLSLPPVHYSLLGFFEFAGNFVVVDASGRDQALESGSKIACVVSQVLFHDQVRAMEKSEEWPAIFKSTSKEGSEAGTQEGTKPQIEEEPDSDEDDDLPPLETNTNRQRPFELYADSDSDSDS